MSDLRDRLAPVLIRACPEFRVITALERLSGGASQETYQIDIETARGARRLALRREAGGQPIARTSGQLGLSNEARLFNCVRTAGVPVPEILAVLAPEDDLGEGFVMPWLEGETLGTKIVRDPKLAAVRPRLAYQCGEILARIHGVDLAKTDLYSFLQPVTPSDLVESTWANYRAFHSPQPMIDYTARWLLANLPTVERYTLTHGDFRNGNLMIDGDGVHAVLDWEIAHLGDPMRDLGWMCTNSWRFGHSSLPVGGFGLYADLFAGYTSVSGHLVNPAHVRFWEVFGSFWWAVGCLKMAEHFRVGPDKTVERPAIGRRSSECQIDCVNLLIPGPADVVAGAESDADDSLPRTDELLSSVRDFLRDEVVANSEKRTAFLARIAANSLDIALRELTLGDEARRRESARLKTLVGAVGNLDASRWSLIDKIRGDAAILDDPALIFHLRSTVLNQVLIDQPGYSGCATALKFTQ
ncbi:MAG: phosphotransferase family protein [Gammaproteobacteria bacterium]|nr:phosphotransferase family protein [Gammaproteobacteria bacterium]